MVQFYIYSLIIDFVSCLDIWNQEPANPIHHHQDRHLKRHFAGQSRSSPPTLLRSPQTPLCSHMLTSLLPPPRRQRAGQRVSGCDAASRSCGCGWPGACRGIASRRRRGWQTEGPWQGRRGQEYQGMNKRVCACNDLKLKPLLMQ